MFRGWGVGQKPPKPVPFFLGAKTIHPTATALLYPNDMGVHVPPPTSQFSSTADPMDRNRVGDDPPDSVANAVMPLGAVLAGYEPDP